MHHLQNFKYSEGDNLYYLLPVKELYRDAYKYYLLGIGVYNCKTDKVVKTLTIPESDDISFANLLFRTKSGYFIFTSVNKERTRKLLVKYKPGHPPVQFWPKGLEHNLEIIDILKNGRYVVNSKPYKEERPYVTFWHDKTKRITHAHGWLIRSVSKNKRYFCATRIGDHQNFYVFKVME